MPQKRGSVWPRGLVVVPASDFAGTDHQDVATAAALVTLCVGARFFVVSLPVAPFAD